MKDRILEFLADYWGVPVAVVAIILAACLGFLQRQ